MGAVLNRPIRFFFGIGLHVLFAFRVRKLWHNVQKKNVTDEVQSVLRDRDQSEIPWRVAKSRFYLNKRKGHES